MCAHNQKGDDKSPVSTAVAKPPAASVTPSFPGNLKPPPVPEPVDDRLPTPEHIFFGPWD